MMREQSKNRFQMPMGTSSLVMVFAVLCMTIFCVLALLTANREMRLAEKSADNAANYYAADITAEQVAAELTALSRFGGDIPEELNGITLYPSVKNGVRMVSFLAPIDENRAIEVGINWDDTQITVYRVINQADWTPDDSLNLWDGESPFLAP